MIRGEGLGIGGLLFFDSELETMLYIHRTTMTQ